MEVSLISISLFFIDKKNHGRVIETGRTVYNNSVNLKVPKGADLKKIFTRWLKEKHPSRWLEISKRKPLVKVCTSHGTYYFT